MHGFHCHISKENHESEVVDWEHWLGQWLVPLSQLWKNTLLPLLKELEEIYLKREHGKRGMSYQEKLFKKAVKLTARETISKHIEGGKRLQTRKNENQLKLRKYFKTVGFIKNIKY